jgi:hypothetical protein
MKKKIKSVVFSDVTPCTLLEAYLHFEGNYHLHLQGGRISQASRSKVSIFAA